ncbi:MAG TPA: pilus assembly protein TadG-related protein, partial [Candidatus Dormibacteraeota bacterium]|nr:pilus assembly protein TadG-related protein [Candidatus Dormibacteraeota bacterium]
MRVRRRRRGEHGQVMIVLSLALIVLLGMMAVALDGGYALVQARRAQNAADFASIAGTASLKALCEQGAAPPTDQRVHAVIQDVIDQNANSIGSNWTADYVDQAGNDRGAAVSTSAATVPPPYACGVTVQLNSTWLPYIAQVLGVTTLSTNASAKALNGVQPGKTVGIVALDKVGPHSILGNGQGSFTVHGDIFANSAVPNNPWTSTQAGGYSYTDVIDAKDNSNLSVFGNLISVTGMPFDWCFGSKNVP